MNQSRVTYLGSLVFIAIVFLYVFRLDFPHKIYYDEVYHVRTAREFITLSANYENTHPPFGKILIAAAIKTFGDISWAWRFFPVLAGLGILLVFQRLAKRLLNSEAFGWLATVLFALDGISITQARIAMLNTFMLFFMMLTVFFFVRILESGGTRKREFIGCGIALGLTVGSRWVGAGVFAILGMLFLKDFQKIRSKMDFVKNTALFVVPIALGVYFATHLIIPFIKGFDFADIWNYQIGMLRYHANLVATHRYDSPWWSWPLMKRPIWYFFDRQNGIVNGILCIGNPAQMWVLFPVMAYLIWRFVRYRSWAAALIVAGFLSQWLPWAFIGRVKFFHYFYTAMPFVALAITMALKDAWQNGPEAKAAVTAYLVLVVVMFFYWFPLLTGLPITEAYFQNHIWFKSWI